MCNVIPNIQEIKVINACCDGVTDVTTIERVAIMKSKTMAQLLAITNECVEVSEARYHLEKGKGKKKHKDQEVHAMGFCGKALEGCDLRAWRSGARSTSRSLTT